MVFLRKSEQVIFITICLLCTFLSDSSTPDRALSIRNIVLAAGAFVLFGSVMTRVSVGDTELAALRHPVTILYGLFFAAILLSGVNAVNRSEWLYEVLRAFVFGILLVCIPSVVKEKTIIKTMCMLSFAIGSWGMLQIIVLAYNAGAFVRNDYAGFMGNKNLWASAFMLLAPFAWYGGIKNGKWWKIIGITAALAGVVNVFFLMCRAAITGFIAALTSVSIFKRQMPMVLLVVLIILALFMLSFPEVLFNVWSMKERIEVWKASFGMFKDAPVIGVGAGNWKLALAKYNRYIEQKAAFVRLYYRQPHNDFIWVLCEMGVIGFMAYISIFAAIVYYCIKAKNYLVLAVLASYSVAANFSFPRERAFHSLIFIVLCSLVILRSPVKIKMPGMLVVPVAGLGLIILALAVVDFSYRHSSERAIKRIKETTDWSAVLDETEKFNIFSTLDMMTAPVYWYKGLANFTLGNISQSLRDFKHAEKANPNHPYVLNGVGATLAKMGELEEAKVYFVKALEMCPAHEGAQMNLKKIIEHVNISKRRLRK